MFKALSARFRPKRSRKTEKALDQIVLQQETGINPRSQQSPKREKALNEIGIQQEATINPGKFVGPVEKPRTANKAFGGISDFMLFFENRNPEMKKFAKDFKEIEKMDSESSIKELNKVLAPKIDKCITEMYKKLGTKLKNKYTGLFTIVFETWEQFYKKVLCAYTIAGFLYQKMNEFLRNEDWEKLDDLLPYTYSLFKAFLWEPTAAEFSKTFEFLRSITNENKLILYRGADFDDDSLRFYNTNQIKYFSWNGVTSTSLDVSAARGFQNISSSKIPVLMTIEIDFENLNPQDLNALHLEGVSQHPKEKEVALPPGSIFELLSRSEKKSEVEIKLKLVTDPKILARQGQFMHGMLQAMMGEEDELKVVCLREKELSRAIKHFKGNQLISKLEFSLCSFNEKSAKVFQMVLPTMKNLESFTFNSIEFEEEFSFDQIVKCLGILKITKLELANSISNESEFQSFIGQIQHFGLLKSLKLSFPQDYWTGDHLMGELNNQVSQHLDPQCVFELKRANVSAMIVKGLNLNNFLDHIGEAFRQKMRIGWSEISAGSEGSEGPDNSQKENGLSLTEIKKELRFSFIGKDHQRSLKTTLLEALRHEVKPLKTLNLSFDECQYIDNQDIKNLICNQEIQHFESLTTLNLDFKGCSAITDTTLKILSEDVLWQLPGLNNLNLCFDGCVNLTDESLKNLICGGIQRLLFLTTLRLSFNGCRLITDQGLGYFSNLEEIKSLSLSFEHCIKITYKGFRRFLGPRTLQFLKNLDLNFSHCPLITDKALVLIHKYHQNLKGSLTSLSLKFDSCGELTDKGFKTLICEGIYHLKSLHNLCLSFENSDPVKSRITDQGIFPLVNFINGSSLKSLHLNFDNHRNISSPFLTILRFPKKLITLHLSFNECCRIGLAVLQGLSHLTSLEDLSLIFQHSEAISEKDFELLCCQGIKHLKKLKILHIDFLKYLNTFRDASFTHLGADAIQHLPELRTLRLNFVGHRSITHVGLRSLSLYLKNLTELHFGFSEVTDQGLEALNYQAISLETLSLTFHSSRRISNEGLRKFWRERFRSLLKLKNLSLHFGLCKQITYEGLKDIFQKGIRHLTSLISLNIDFESCGTLHGNEIALLQSQIDLLDLPQLEFPVKILYSRGELRISSRGSRPPGFVLCQYQYGSELSSKKEEKEQNTVESLTLTFEKEHFLPYLDIPKTLCTLKTLKDLKNLHLTFDGYGQITNFTLHKLCTRGIRHLESLTSLYLSFALCNQINERGLRILVFRGIKYVKLLVSLSLNFDGCRVTDKGIKHLCNRGIRPLKFLKVLNLSFKFCNEITNKSIKRLYHKGMKSLTSFFIDFSGVTITERLKRQLFQSSSSSSVLISKNKLDSKISVSRLQRQNIDPKNIRISRKDSGEIVRNKMFTLYKGRKHYELHTQDDEKSKKYRLQTAFDLDTIKINQINTIPLLFLSSKAEITIKFINQDLLYWHSLVSLHLALNNWGNYVTDSALNTLCLEVFPHLKTLTILNLNFKSCYQITDDGLKHLTDQGIRHLRSSLTTLYLDFTKCEKITDQGLQNLWSDGILCLGLLTTLDLSFEQCYRITGTCFRSSLKGIKNLTSLALSFEDCWDFEDGHFQKFCFEVVQNLKKLKIIHLNLYGCRISHSGLQYLSLQKKSLFALSLKFDNYFHTTDQGIQDLIIRSTTALHLDLSHRQKINLDITDQEIHDLTLLSASALDLDVNHRQKITLNLKFFNSLKILHLSLKSCSDVVTDQALKDLCNTGLKNLISLNVLGLCFDECQQITDEGIQTLSSDGIQFMKELTILYLSFGECNQITEKGLDSLCYYGITNLDSLTNLYLCFSSCQGISDTDLSTLMNQINSLPLPQLLRPVEIDSLGCIFSQSNPVLPRILDQSLSQKLRDQKIMNTMIQKSKSISHLYAPQNDGAENLKKIDAVSILFDSFQNIVNDFISILCPNDPSYSLYSSFSDHRYEPYPFDGVKVKRHSRYSKVKFPPAFEITGKITENDFENLCSERVQNPVELMKLRLKFVNEVETRKDLYQYIWKIKQLKALDLNLGDLTDGKFEFFVDDRFNNLEQLENLHLNFNGDHRITDDELAAFCNNGIQNLKKLKKLHINFDGCNALTDEALKSILRGILKLSLIENLELSFLDCPKIQPSSHQNFLKILSYFGFMEIDQTFKSSKSLKNKEVNN